jgi:hypothetical protein
MNEPNSNNTQGEPKRRYIWPWFLLAAVLLGIALAILWMSYEIKRTKRNRDLSSPRSHSGIVQGAGVRYLLARSLSGHSVESVRAVLR